jgi:hypothetical protein
MEYRQWDPLYRQIVADFGYDPGTDDRVARRLDEVLGGKRVREGDLEELLRGHTVTILGNGPRLAEEMPRAIGVLIAADEATTVALSRGITPHVIVTDLDGRVEDQLEANRRGSIALVLGHGDNLPAVERWAPRFEGPVMAMTQGRPHGDLHNFGGFTDGDRAAFLAHHFGASEVRLLGFDFDHPSPKDAPGEVKLRKLGWAKKLLDLLGLLGED